MPIIDRQRRLHETGRIRIGRSVEATTEQGKRIRRPEKLQSFRFTSASRHAIESIAALYGGEPHEWTDGPQPGQWEVFTAASAIEVVVPPEHLAFSQWFELWKAGGCERRCDGVAQIPTGEVCLCDAEDRECKPHTRLSLLLPRLLGSGLWRLDTQGEYAATELGGAFEFAMFLHQATGRTLLPGRLVLTQRSIKRPRQARRDFVVPVLELDADLDALSGRPSAPAIANGSVPAPAIDAGVAPGPVIPIPPGPIEVAPTMGEALATTEAPPAPSRRRTAEPIKATGRKPRPRSGGDKSEPPAAEGSAAPETPPVAAPAPPTSPAPSPPAGREPVSLMTEQQRKAIFKLLDRLHVAEDQRHVVVGEILEREVTTFIRLSFDDASRTIEVLNEQWHDAGERMAEEAGF